MLDNFVEKQETFYGLYMLLVKKCQFFLYLVLVKTTLEIRLCNVLDRKETFFEYKNKIFQTPKYGIFPKGLTHAFGKKMPILFFFGFGQNRSRNKGK